jgi:hypothetical protein
MVLEHILLNKRSALLTFEGLLRTCLQVDVHVTLLDSLSTLEWTLSLKIIDQLLKAHVRLEAEWQSFLACRAFALSQIIKARLTDDISALHAIERNLRKLEAYDTFQLIER